MTSINKWTPCNLFYITILIPKKVIFIYSVYINSNRIAMRILFQIKLRMIWRQKYSISNYKSIKLWFHNFNKSIALIHDTHIHIKMHQSITNPPSINICKYKGTYPKDLWMIALTHYTHINFAICQSLSIEYESEKSTKMAVKSKVAKGHICHACMYLYLYKMYM